MFDPTKFVKLRSPGQIRHILTREGDPVEYFGIEHVFYDTSSFRPRVSVFLSVFKGWKYMQSFFPTINQQTMFTETEFIFMLVPPHDECLPFLKEKAQLFPNVRVIEFERDPDLYPLWNFAGKTLARAPYLHNWNLDDLRHPEFLETLVAALDASPALDYVTCPVYVTTTFPRDFSEVIGASRPWHSDAPALLTASDLVKWDGQGQFKQAYNVPHNGPVWRRTLHERYGYFNWQIMSIGDWELWMRALAQGGRAWHRKRDPLVHYLLDAQSHGHRTESRAPEAWKQLHVQSLNRFEDVLRPKPLSVMVLFTRPPILTHALDMRIFNFLEAMTDNAFKTHMVYLEEPPKQPEQWKRTEKVTKMKVDVQHSPGLASVPGKVSQYGTLNLLLLSFDYESLQFDAARFHELVAVLEKVKQLPNTPSRLAVYLPHVPSRIARISRAAKDQQQQQTTESSGQLFSSLFRTEELPDIQDNENALRALLEEEKRIWAAADLVLVGSPADETYLRALFGGSSVATKISVTPQVAAQAEPGSLAPEVSVFPLHVPVMGSSRAIFSGMPEPNPYESRFAISTVVLDAAAERASRSRVLTRIFPALRERLLALKDKLAGEMPVPQFQTILDPSVKVAAARLPFWLTPRRLDKDLHPFYYTLLIIQPLQQPVAPSSLAAITLALAHGVPVITTRLARVEMPGCLRSRLSDAESSSFQQWQAEQEALLREAGEAVDEEDDLCPFLVVAETEAEVVNAAEAIVRDEQRWTRLSTRALRYARVHLQPDSISTVNGLWDTIDRLRRPWLQQRKDAQQISNSEARPSPSTP